MMTVMKIAAGRETDSDFGTMVARSLAPDFLQPRELRRSDLAYQSNQRQDG